MPPKGKNTTRTAGEGVKRPKAAPVRVAPPRARPAPPVAAVPPAPRVAPTSPQVSDPPMFPTLKGHAMTNFETMSTATRDKLKQAQQTAYKTVEELTRFQKDNWEAFVSASQIAAKGAESVSKAWIAFTKEAMESAASTAKALIGAKTLREAVDLQQGFAKVHFDKFVAESTKQSEMGVKVANEAFGPLTVRLNVAVEKILKPVAA